MKRIMLLMLAGIMLAANIYRMRKGQGFKKLYFTIMILNVVSVPFGGGMSFFTTMHYWPLTLVSYYEILFGDGFSHHYRWRWLYDLYSYSSY